jgi:hypothetical protein
MFPQLPLELIFEVLLLCSTSDILTLSFVSKQSYSLCNNDYLWKLLLQRDYSWVLSPKRPSKPSNLTYKEYYKEVLKYHSFITFPMKKGDAEEVVEFLKLCSGLEVLKLVKPFSTSPLHLSFIYNEQQDKVTLLFWDCVDLTYVGTKGPGPGGLYVRQGDRWEFFCPEEAEKEVRRLMEIGFFIVEGTAIRGKGAFKLLTSFKEKGLIIDSRS